MGEEDRAALREIAEKLAELERQAEEAGLPMVALLLRQAREEAEARIGEGGAPPATDR